MGRGDDLYITIPTFFKCPISLDVMESPVSLCTGVTYDRTSIKRWLDSGHNTCPATMQILDSQDLVPNHTLHRLIQIWSTSAQAQAQPQAQTRPKPDILISLTSQQALDIISHLITAREFDSLVKLLCFATESPENRRILSSHVSFVDFLMRFVSEDTNRESPDLVESGLKILQLIISPKMMTSVMILKTYPGFFSSLARILKTGRPDSKLAVTGIIQMISPDSESKKVIFNNNELLSELIQSLKSYSETQTPQSAIAEAILSIFIAVSTPRLNKIKLVRSGVIRIVTDIIKNFDSDTILTELGLTLLETLSGTAEGRAAITDEPNCVPKVVQKLMKVTSSGNEHGIALLWSLCYFFRDQKAKEAVMKSNGGLTKILLLMQSDCSPAVKRMCCDLLRIFRVNSKSCLANYDSKTTHIMPC